MDVRLSPDGNETGRDRSSDHGRACKVIMTDDVRTELLAFLDEHAFDPVLRTAADRVDRREEFEDAQCYTERARRRFHACASGAAIYDCYVTELHDGTARRIDRELDRLGLPTLRRLQQAFEILCARLGIAVAVPAEAQPRG